MSDLTEDVKQSDKIGDIVFVAPDNHTWGKKEGLPNFEVVQIPGLVEDYKYLTNPIFEQVNSVISASTRKIFKINKLLAGDTEIEREVIVHKRYKIDFLTNTIIDKENA